MFFFFLNTLCYHIIKTPVLKTHSQHNGTFLTVPYTSSWSWNKVSIEDPASSRFTAEPRDFSKFTYFTQLHDSSLGTLFVGGIASQT